jgi:hypothetical protein
MHGNVIVYGTKNKEISHAKCYNGVLSNFRQANFFATTKSYKEGTANQAFLLHVGSQPRTPYITRKQSL